MKLPARTLAMLRKYAPNWAKIVEKYGINGLRASCPAYRTIDLTSVYDFIYELSQENNRNFNIGDADACLIAEARQYKNYYMTRLFKWDSKIEPEPNPTYCPVCNNFAEAFTRCAYEGNEEQLKPLLTGSMVHISKVHSK